MASMDSVSDGSKATFLTPMLRAQRLDRDLP
jgi:hypothetical protein